jgi:predicted phosphate transport protein (TIGR00153 family)
MQGIFSRTKDLEAKIDRFLDTATDVGLLFQEAVRDYMGHRIEEFERRRQRVSDLEKEADALRLEVERQLYTYTLIPEARGDVLGLLEQTDEVINNAKTALMRFSVQRPRVPEDLAEGYVELAIFGGNAVDELIQGIRAYFLNDQSVPDRVHKVKFWEKEADAVAEQLKRRVFEKDIELARKIHLDDFVQYIDMVADVAEDVSERLAISAIKRFV